MDTILFSHKSDNWATPCKIYNYFIKNNYFDPCPLNSYFDGLSIEWKNKNFVNPPYSKIKFWVEKSIIENMKGKVVVLLIPARVDTQYFKKLVDYGVDLYFIVGRLSFNNFGSAPFPSCFVILKNNKITKSFWVNRQDLFSEVLL